MATPEFFFFPFFLLFFLQPMANGETCQDASCGGVIIHYPFRLADQPDCCGNAGFNLSCRNPTQTPIITFPFAGEYRVDVIGYSSPNLLISDPDNCTPKRLLQGLDLFGTFFEPRYPESHLFFNCSSNVPVGYPATYISCLSGINFSVVAIPTILYNQSSSLRSCLEIATISVPLPSPDLHEYFMDEILLTWEEPDCQHSCNCESRGGGQFKKKNGLTRGTKYAITFIVGIPISLLVVFLIYYYLQVGPQDQRHHSNVEISSFAEPQMAPAVRRIEAYPITLLGESCRLPRPNDNACTICLSDYKAKEIIRTIPDCDHYFHADCIDEWLRLNASCPVCRNTPDQETALINHSTLSPSSSPPP